MIDNTGWICLHRKIKSHWIWENPEYLKAWICILLEVNHDKNKVLIEKELIECNTGQSLHSLKSWSKLFGKKWSIHKVRTFFILLENDSMIVREGLRKTSRVTVCNYDSYQKIGQADGRQTAGRRQADGRQTATNNNDNNENNKNKEDIEENPDDSIESTRTDFSNIYSMFNLMFEKKLPLPKCLTDSRKKAIKARISQHGIESIETVFSMVSKSDFLLGQNDKNWKCDFDWIFKQSNYVKILEGNYNNQRSYNNGRTNANNGKIDPDTAKQQRQAAVAEYIAQELGGPD